MARERKIGNKILSAAIFIGLEIAAFSMLKESGRLQSFWLDEASNGVRGWLWNVNGNVSNFLSLPKENQALADEVFRLNEELRSYRKLIEDSQIDTTGMESIFDDFMYIPAKIVKISRNKQHNYFILNKGSEDGVTPQSGVITDYGVVGIIEAVDSHHSYGLSFMNSGISISARLGKDGALGPLYWDGISMDKAILKEIPLQYKFAPQDTVWTSGFSSIFPPDIPLGQTGESKIINGAVNQIDVSLFQSFSSIKHVTVTVNTSRAEINYLERLEEGGE